MLDHGEADREPERVATELLEERPEDEARDRAVDDVEHPADRAPVRAAGDEQPEDRDVRVGEAEDPAVERLDEAPNGSRSRAGERCLEPRAHADANVRRRSTATPRFSSA